MVFFFFPPVFEIWLPRLLFPFLSERRFRERTRKSKLLFCPPLLWAFPLGLLAQRRTTAVEKLGAAWLVILSRLCTRARERAQANERQPAEEEKEREREGDKEREVWRKKRANFSSLSRGKKKKTHSFSKCRAVIDPIPRAKKASLPLSGAWLHTLYMCTQVRSTRKEEQQQEKGRGKEGRIGEKMVSPFLHSSSSPIAQIVPRASPSSLQPQRSLASPQTIAKDQHNDSRYELKFKKFLQEPQRVLVPFISSSRMQQRNPSEEVPSQPR